MGDLVAALGLPFQYLANAQAKSTPSALLAVVCRQRPSVQSARRGQLSLGISGRIPPPPRLCTDVHLDGGICPVSVQFPGCNNPLHHLYLFHRQRFHQLVARPHRSVARAGSITFSLQKMVDHLGFLFSLELLLYFWGYEQPPNHPPIWWFLAHPITAIEYILLFFGGPFSYGTNLPSNPVGLGTGALLLLMLLIAGFYIWRQRSDRSLLGEPCPG